MNAKRIVTKLIEADENPNDFLDRHQDIHVQSETPAFVYHFNIGEGSYRCGISFDINAGSRREAVILANRYIRHFFRGGYIDLPAEDKEYLGSPKGLNVYIDDDFMVTDQDIISETPLSELGANPDT